MRDYPPGTGLIIAGIPALYGAKVLTKEHLASLENDFRFPFWKPLLAAEPMSNEAALCILKKLSLEKDSFPLGKDGILGGLWHFCEAHDCGIRVRLAQIPLQQEIIELCEYLYINPYRIDACDNYLIASPNTAFIKDALIHKGLVAATIGYLTSDKDRIIFYDDKEQYLTPPRDDV